MQFHVKSARVVAGKTFLGDFLDPVEAIDRVMYVCFQAPKSYTGEDMVEIYAHGSPWIVKEIISCGIRWGLHPSSAGEFTKIAVQNKKMSPMQAESLQIFLTSSNKIMRQKSLQILCGGRLDFLQKIQENLQKILVTVEASLEFGERDVVELSDTTVVQQQLQEKMAPILEEISIIISKFRRENKIEKGIKIALIGRPNAGKSSLMNAFVQKQRMLVSDIPGTTRDFVQESMYLEDILFTLIDTAGLTENTKDFIEAMGVQKTKEILPTADLIFYVATDKEDIVMLETIRKNFLIDGELIVLLNKKDLLSKADCKEIENFFYEKEFPIQSVISTFATEDIQKIKTDLQEKFRPKLESSDMVQIISERQAKVLEMIFDKLKILFTMLQNQEELVIFAQELREIAPFWEELEIQGIHTKPILEDVFSQFCIGK